MHVHHPAGPAQTATRTAEPGSSSARWIRVREGARPKGETTHMPTLTIPDRLRRSPRPPATPDVTPPEGFEYSKAPSARAAKWTRIGWRFLVILGVLLLAVLVIQNIKANNRAATAPSTAAVNPDAAPRPRRGSSGSGTYTPARTGATKRPSTARLTPPD